MLVIFIGLITFIFNMHGWRFYLEFIVLIGLLFFAAISVILIFNEINFGYVLSAVISAIALINLILIYTGTDMSNLLFLAIISSIVAFVVSTVNIGEKKEVERPEAKVEKPKVTYTPGKVVSSKRAKYYHAPKCDWAKKIKKINRVWFSTEEQAKKAGLKAHECME